VIIQHLLNIFVFFFVPEIVLQTQNAMKAYYNDIQNNPDYSSQVLIKEKGLTIRPTPYIMTQNPAGPHVNISYSKNNMPVSIKPAEEPKPEYIWHQSRTEDGSDLMYYWNTVTGGQCYELNVYSGCLAVFVFFLYISTFLESFNFKI